MPTGELLSKLSCAGMPASYARVLTVISSARSIPPTVSASAALTAFWALVALSAVFACCAFGTVPSSDSLIWLPPSVSGLISCGPSDRFLTSTPVSELLATFAPVIFSAA